MVPAPPYIPPPPCAFYQGLPPPTWATQVKEAKADDDDFHDEGTHPFYTDDFEWREHTRNMGPASQRIEPCAIYQEDPPVTWAIRVYDLISAIQSRICATRTDAEGFISSVIDQSVENLEKARCRVYNLISAIQSRICATRTDVEGFISSVIDQMGFYAQGDDKADHTTFEPIQVFEHEEHDNLQNEQAEVLNDFAVPVDEICAPPAISPSQRRRRAIRRSARLAAKRRSNTRPTASSSEVLGSVFLQDDGSVIVDGRRRSARIIRQRCFG